MTSPVMACTELEAMVSVQKVLPELEKSDLSYKRGPEGMGFLLSSFKTVCSRALPRRYLLLQFPVQGRELKSKSA